MNNDRTRTFKAIYTDNDQRQYHLDVKIFKRLAFFGLSLLLLRMGISMAKDSPNESLTATSKFEDETFSEDKALIERIIAEKPYILKDIIETTYTIEPGDTLRIIADKTGTTIDRLCSVNNIKKEDTIYAGGNLRIEKYADKSEIDGTIAALESYFYDYMFKSPVVTVATKTDTIQTPQVTYYRNLIFGSPKSETDVDAQSIYGRYITAYIAYHDKKDKPTKEETTSYMNTLADLAVTAEEELNLGGTTEVIVPFEQYKTFLQKGTTKEPASIITK